MSKVNRILTMYDVYRKKKNNLAKVLVTASIPLDCLDDLDAAVLNYVKAAYTPR